MAMTPREVVRRTVTFQNPDRIPYYLPPEFGSDFHEVNIDPSPDGRPGNGVDEWGCEWENIGICRLGEVKRYPLVDWSDWDRLPKPDIRESRRWEAVKGIRARAGDHYLLAYGISLYERVHFLRGLENTWVDIHENPRELERLIDLLVEMNRYAIERYAAAGVDGYLFCDDWGLQNRFMIAPADWRRIWKPRYAQVYQAAHAAGMTTWLHSCGHIVDVLDDLIECGLDVIQMDQQENMGLEELGRRFGGRITFWCPVDIQTVMAHGTLDEIRAYCGRLIRVLGRPAGGYIAKWYPDPVGAGHRPEAVRAMAEEFLRLCHAPKKG